MRNILSISGSDSSGGAGMQCDIKTIAAFGLNALSVITSVTAQNSSGLHAKEHTSSFSVKSQLRSILADLSVHAIKTGMIPTRESIEAVSDALVTHCVDKPYVLDPVFATTSGSALMDEGSCQLMIDRLIPLATVVTPNVAEAEHLSGRKISSIDDAIDAAGTILQYGCRFVLVKGGHMPDLPGYDVLVGPSGAQNAEKIESVDFQPERDVHGTGCAMASAIACGLAKGRDVREAVVQAKLYVTRAIANAHELARDFWTLDHQASHTD